MRKAFVFGKFLPFHKGHEAMIRFALTQCDYLSVLICCSEQETVDAVTRKAWMDETFRNEQRIEILTYHYDEQVLPSTSETSAAVSEVWAIAFKELFPDYNIVVTSEPYGELVAGFMGIRHIPFDMERKVVPVSATKVRNNLHETWNFLPDSVKASLAIRVVILGTESTGKTTLTARLADHFNATAVMEAGRDIVTNSNDFSIGDLYTIATTHAARIGHALTGHSPLLIIDTDIHTTISYGEFVYNKTIEVEANIFKLNKADLYIYLHNDAPFIQDGTRMSKEERDLLDISHRKVLKQYGVRYETINGGWEDRFEQSVALVENLLFDKLKRLANFRSQGANLSSITRS